MGGWPQAHRRYELVYGVAEDVAREGVSALYRRRVEIIEEYGDLGEFLLDVKRRYREGVNARLDEVLAVNEADRDGVARRARAEVDHAYRSLRRLVAAAERRDTPTPEFQLA